MADTERQEGLAVQVDQVAAQELSPSERDSLETAGTAEAGDTEQAAAEALEAILLAFSSTLPTSRTRRTTGSG